MHPGDGTEGKSKSPSCRGHLLLRAEWGPFCLEFIWVRSRQSTSSHWLLARLGSTRLLLTQAFTFRLRMPPPLVLIKPVMGMLNLTALHRDFLGWYQRVRTDAFMSPLFRVGWPLASSRGFLNVCPAREYLIGRGNLPESKYERVKLTLCEQTWSPRRGAIASRWSPKVGGPT